MANETSDTMTPQTEMTTGGSFAFTGMIHTFAGKSTQHISDFFDTIDITVLASWTDRQCLGIAKIKLTGIIREYAWHDFKVYVITFLNT